MLVVYNGKQIEVEPVMEDSHLKFFKGENRNYYASEVVYDKNDLPDEVQD
jgi:hypothetical protein